MSSDTTEAKITVVNSFGSEVTLKLKDAAAAEHKLAEGSTYTFTPAGGSTLIAEDSTGTVLAPTPYIVQKDDTVEITAAAAAPPYDRTLVLQYIGELNHNNNISPDEHWNNPSPYIRNWCQKLTAAAEGDAGLIAYSKILNTANEEDSPKSHWRNPSDYLYAYVEAIKFHVSNRGVSAGIRGNLLALANELEYQNDVVSRDAPWHSPSKYLTDWSNRVSISGNYGLVAYDKFLDVNNQSSIKFPWSSPSRTISLFITILRSYANASP